MCQVRNTFVFLENKTFFSSGRRPSLAVLAVWHAGSRLYATAQMRTPGEVRGACSGPSTSRILAYKHGEAFRSATAKQVHGNPHTQKYSGRRSHVVRSVRNSLRLAWSPGTSSVAAWAPGYLESRRSSSRATAVTLRTRFFLPPCICACTR